MIAILFEVSLPWKRMWPHLLDAILLASTFFLVLERDEGVSIIRKCKLVNANITVGLFKRALLLGNGLSDSAPKRK
jgi:hypothetical protein